MCHTKSKTLVVIFNPFNTAFFFNIRLFKTVVFLASLQRCWAESDVEWPKHIQEKDLTRYYRCSDIGKFPLNNDCRKFHICILREMFTIELFTCEKGKMLDLELQQCVDEKTAVCRRKPKNGTTTQKPISNEEAITTTTFENVPDTTAKVSEGHASGRRMVAINKVASKSKGITTTTASPITTSEDSLADGTEDTFNLDEQETPHESASVDSLSDKTSSFTEPNNYEPESVSHSSYRAASEYSTSETSI